jgi:hypothetical protein
LIAEAKEAAMTMSTVLIVSAITSAFLLFGGVLAWGDFYSRGARQDTAPQLPEPKRAPESLERRKAA